MQHKFSRLSAILLILPILCVLMTGTSQTAQAALPNLSFVILDKTSVTMDVGEHVKLQAFANSFKAPAWTSSSPKIASVDYNGRITAKKAGTAVITASISGGGKAKCTVTVRKTVVRLDRTSLSLSHGGRAVLTATASNGGKITWSSKNAGIAVVARNGEVVGVRPGKTTVTASSGNGKASCTVTVRKPKISLDKTKVTLRPGKKYKLLVAITSPVAPSWTTSNKKVATVDKNGQITAVKRGTAVITAQLDGVRATCKVTVQ